MAYGRYPYGGVAYAASDVDDIPAADTEVALAVEWSPTTGALDAPVWVDIAGDVRRWDTTRGRTRELERFQPGRATIVLSNRERQYDSVNTAGPNYGNVKPMRRIRIRETFNGVTYPTFDGLIDRWHLDYPGVGKDATATVTATDAFKVFARTDMGISVYHRTVLADSPSVYWRLDEQKETASDGSLLALNSGTLGPASNGTYIGPPSLGEEALVVNDPGSSIGVVNSADETGTAGMGVEATAAVFPLVPAGTESFAFEAWCIPRNTPGSNGYLLSVRNAASTVKIEVLYTASNTFVFNVNHTTPVSLSTSPTTYAPHQRAHVVGRCVVGETLRLWINGTLFTGGTPAGTIDAAGTLRLAHLAAASPSVNWSGAISHVSFYRDAAAVAVDTAWVARHYADGTAPWNADQPGARMGRALDIASWPAPLRELNAGNVALQSAELGVTVLEHLQKVGETEFGLVFMTRDGKVRLVGRAAVLTRGPGPEVFGDGPGEAGYTSFVPDDGDEVIRNSTTISRLNGVAKTSEDTASVTAYGRFAYVLDGLLHSSDQYSADYAATITSEYKDPRRRIVSLTCGPAIAGEEDTVYPAMLGPELGDVITVVNNPLGGGAEFQQACAIEGITCAGTPGGVRTTTFALSPTIALSEEVDMAWTAWTPTLTNMTLGSGTLDCNYVRIGQTIHFRFRFLLGAGSAVGTNPEFSLPVAANAEYLAEFPLGEAIYVDAGTKTWEAFCEHFNTDTTAVLRHSDGAGAFTTTTATAPFTWTTNDYIMAIGTYEAAF